MANGGELVRRGESAPQAFDTHGVAQSDAMGGEITRTAETGMAPLEAQARAMVQARFWIANQPHMRRNWDQVEQRLRKECVRPGFAQSAWWILPYGSDSKKYPKGLSIRFAEAALRMSGNIDVQVQTVFDDSWKRIVRVTVLDLETNFAYTVEATIDKTVERSDPKGRDVLVVRQNSQGKMTYVVAATEQELALKQGSAVSKAIRTNGLRLIPGDILDMCKDLIEDTRAKGAQAEDPETARKQILDSFADVGVMPEEIARYLEHDTDIFQPAERDLLRGIFRAIRDGQATWKDVLEAKLGQEGREGSEGAKKIKDRLARQREQQKPAAPATTDPQPLSKEEAERAVDTIAAGNRGKAEPVPEVDELPDPKTSKRDRVYFEGVLYELIEDHTAWVKAEQPGAPASKPAEQPKAETPKPTSAKPHFGRRS